MLSNSTITFYHKSLNENRLEIWNRYLFENVWTFNSTNANVNRGYENSNSIEVRIPLNAVQDTTIFQLGDIVSMGNNEAITKQEDLEGKQFYNITTIKINDFGSTPHIHLGGR